MLRTLMGALGDNNGAEAMEVLSILDQLPTAVFVLRGDGRPLYANRAAVELLGRGVDPDIAPEELGPVFQVYLAETGEPYPRERMPAVRALRGETSTVDDMVVRRPDGEIQLEVWGAPIYDEAGQISFAVATFRDITARKELERRVGLDPLTGLANRSALAHHLRRALDRLDRRPGILAVLFVDLNGFKPINDRHGHPVGDEVLRTVARRLSRASRRCEQPYRFGGDEFVVVCEGLPSEDSAARIARRLQRAIAAPIPTAVGTMKVTAAIGVAAARHSEVHPEDLLGRADEDMYVQKETAAAIQRVAEELSLSDSQPGLTG